MTRLAERLVEAHHVDAVVMVFVGGSVAGAIHFYLAGMGVVTGLIAVVCFLAIVFLGGYVSDAIYKRWRQS